MLNVENVVLYQRGLSHVVNFLPFCFGKGPGLG
jgi:hypothetical protein